MSDFELQIETNDTSFFDDERVTICWKELQPKEHRFVMTSMTEVDLKLEGDVSIVA